MTEKELADMTRISPVSTPKPAEPDTVLVKLDFYGKEQVTYTMPKLVKIEAEWEEYKKIHHFAQDKELVWPRDFKNHLRQRCKALVSELPTDNVVELR